MSIKSYKQLSNTRENRTRVKNHMFGGWGVNSLANSTGKSFPFVRPVGRTGDACGLCCLGVSLFRSFSSRRCVPAKRKRSRCSFTISNVFFKLVNKLQRQNQGLGDPLCKNNTLLKSALFYTRRPKTIHLCESFVDPL